MSASAGNQHGQGVDLDAISCQGAPPFGGLLGSWGEVKKIVVDVVTNTKEGISQLNRRKDAALDIIYEPAAMAVCPLGHFALRLAFYLLVTAPDRAEHLCREPSPFAMGLSLVDVLASGWPIFGLMGLLAYRLVRDETARGLSNGNGGDERDCPAEIESFRIRYAPAAFMGEDVRFSRDVERHVLEYASNLEAASVGNSSQRCLFGASLPFLGHAASVQCFARRSAPIRDVVARLLEAAESNFLQPADEARPGLATSAMMQACKAQEADLRTSALGLLAAGLWAAEAFVLLQLSAPAFASCGPRPPLGGPEPPPSVVGNAIVSFDPYENRFYGRGLPDFANHIFGRGRLPGFELRPSLPCADVLVVRDSLPGLPYPGALIYVDHEAGIGPGRDAGRLDVLLARHRVIYLGVLEPLAETRCVSRYGSRAAQAQRVCAKVYSGRAPWPPVDTSSGGSRHSRVVTGREHTARAGVTDGDVAALSRAPLLNVLHVPFASTSFMGRNTHTPADLLRGPRPWVDKARFLGYAAYTCVDHRDRLFDLLADASNSLNLGPADALSRCAGYRSGQRRVRNHTRGSGSEYLDEAVELLQPYRFALVFENKLVPGYVTEKIVNAFLAGCIPIYWGSRAILDMFNPDAFIYANEIQHPGSTDEAGADPLDGLAQVAAEVVRIASDDEALHRMATVPVLSEAQFQRYFSWHRGAREGPSPRSQSSDDVGVPDVAARIGEAVAQALEPKRRMGICGGSGDITAGMRLCEVPY